MTILQLCESRPAQAKAIVLQIGPLDGEPAVGVAVALMSARPTCSAGRGTVGERHGGAGGSLCCQLIEAI